VLETHEPYREQSHRKKLTARINIFLTWKLEAISFVREGSREKSQSRALKAVNRSEARPHALSYSK